MDRIADHGLVQVADLDFDLAMCIRDRAKVADMAIAADPDRRALRQFDSGRRIQPLIESGGTAAHEGMR